MATSWGAHIGRVAASGAGTGAGIGTSILPGVGTAIGAGIGAIVGGAGGAASGKIEEEEARDANVAADQEDLNARIAGWEERRQLSQFAAPSVEGWEEEFGL